MFRITTLLFLISVSVTIFSCKTTEETVDRMEEIEQKTAEKIEEEKEGSRGDLLDRYRSNLRDVYASQQHAYPEAFRQREEKMVEDEMDYRGFRIQLISTRRVSIADSTEMTFLKWLNNNPTSYTPNSYTLFRQPYYRVHIGDFQDRERAIRYSRLLKSKFPAAWVVHDRIRPSRVPADSIDMTFASDSLAAKHDTMRTPTDTLSIDLNGSS